MISGSKDLGEVAGLYARGELDSYTGMVAAAAEAAGELAEAREECLAIGGHLLEVMERGLAGTATGLYEKVGAETLEIAAGEFLDLANYLVESDTYVPPTPEGYAALYLVDYADAHLRYRDAVAHNSGKLRGLKNSAARAEKATARGTAGSMAYGKSAAAAYRELVAGISAALDGGGA